MTKRFPVSFPVGMMIMLWLVGWTLRVPILAAPPLATRIAEAFGLSEAGVGALTMLPIVAVAFGAIPAAWAITRFGIRASIVAGLLVMALASVARGYVPSAAMLLIVSVVMGLGVAVFQIALPAATRVWTPTHTAMGSAVYLNGMMVGELASAGLTLPLVLPLAGGDWRFALILWSIPVLIIAALVSIVRAKPTPEEAAKSKSSLASQATLPIWNDRYIWQLGLLVAGTVVAFYVINSYAGVLLQERGESDALKGFLFAYNATPMLGSFAVLAAPKWIGFRNPIAISGVCMALGLAGFTFLQGWVSWMSALVVGFAATVQLILIISLPAVVATGKAITRMSSGITFIGFGVAFILALAGGWLAGRMDWSEMMLIPSLLFTVGVLFAVGRTNRYPDYQ